MLVLAMLVLCVLAVVVLVVLAVPVLVDRLLLAEAVGAAHGSGPHVRARLANIGECAECEAHEFTPDPF